MVGQAADGNTITSLAPERPRQGFKTNHTQYTCMKESFDVLTTSDGLCRTQHGLHTLRGRYSHNERSTSHIRDNAVMLA